MTTLKPTLRFSEFTEKWEVKTFGNIFSFRSTNSFSRENLNYESGSIKNIHYGDIHTKFKSQFNICNEIVPFINEGINLAKIPETNYCQGGDLIIADASEDYADIGKCIEIVNLNNEKTLAGLHTFIARPDLYKMSSGFSGYIMQSRSIRLQIMTIAQGSKVLGISTGRLSRIFLTIPTLPEQTKIANFLTATDQKIEALKEKKSQIQQYKKGIMQQLFSQQLRFKNNNSEDYPEWEIKSLGELGDFFGGGTPETGNSSYWGGEIQWFTPTEIKRDYVENSLRTITDLGLKKSSAKLLEIGTILITTRATLGEVAITTKVCSTNQGFQSLTVNEDNCNVFIFNWLKENKFELIKRANGSTFPEISKSEIEQISLPIPSLPEQTKIANFLTAIDEKIEKVNQQITDTQTFKKGLLQQMFC